jgi:hypothetical protein
MGPLPTKVVGQTTIRVRVSPLHFNLAHLFALGSVQLLRATRRPHRQIKESLLAGAVSVPLHDLVREARLDEFARSLPLLATGTVSGNA